MHDTMKFILLEPKGLTIPKSATTPQCGGSEGDGACIWTGPLSSTGFFMK